VKATSQHVVLDTAALLWWTHRREELTSRAADTIARALARDSCFVSAISLWEIALKARQGKLDLHLPMTEYVRRVERIAGLRIRDVDAKTWLQNVALDWSHRDPADRTIVATAQIHNAALVTSDAVMRDYYSRSVW
jgi:PIN domain nuclease of toxin-antitoxin system